jgi:flagellar M-ring protein FliF
VQQILSVWSALDMRKRSIVGLAALTMFAAVLGLARIASQPSLALLYAGLEAGAAGDVITALEARGAVYDVRGGAIYVDSTRRDELRMTLASEGLPANAAQGYELLDSLSGFGTTSQMFDAAYWRAKEGELARTIVSSPLIQAARVHIATPGPQNFRSQGQPTASVTVTTAAGALSAAHAKALKYLVAAAVSGMMPEDVSVIDGRGGLILSGDEIAPGAADSANRALELRRNVERLLEARVGYGNVVVEVSLAMATETETIVERVLDPESRVAISTETEETTAAASDSQAAGVTVASNLPDGDAADAAGQSTSNNSETRERVNYEVSETTREILRNPGTIRRITVAVLVDGIRSTDANGQEIWAPRPEEEMQALRELVASAVGYDEARGDSITLKSLQFEPIATEGGSAEAGMLLPLNLDAMSLIRLSVLAAVALTLGLFVLRPILGRKPLVPSAPDALPPPGEMATPDADNEAAGGFTPLTPLDGEIDDGSDDFPKMGIVGDFGFDSTESGLAAMGGAGLNPVERLRALIEERQSETVEILRGWMEEEEETT